MGKYIDDLKSTTSYTLVIANTMESFSQHYKYYDNPIEQFRLPYFADWTLWWGGDNKLVILPYYPDHFEFIKDITKWKNTDILSTGTFDGFSLCQLLLDNHALFNRIVDKLTKYSNIKIIPYALTKELLEFISLLKKALPKAIISCEAGDDFNNLWIRDYLDSKIGCRYLLASFNKNILMPNAIVCLNKDEVINSVKSFLKNGESCIIKSNFGENGTGNYVFDINSKNRTSFDLEIENIPGINNETFVVEKFVEALFSPSFEYRIETNTEPEFLYACDQIISDRVCFSGISISQNQYSSCYRELLSHGLSISHMLRDIGYIGVFDIDFLINKEGEVYVTEINTRRTSGTFVHDILLFFFGTEYIRYKSAISIDEIECKTLTFNEVEDRLSLLWFNNKYDCGLLPTITSSLRTGAIGLLAIADDKDTCQNYIIEANKLLNM